MKSRPQHAMARAAPAVLATMLLLLFFFSASLAASSPLTGAPLSIVGADDSPISELIETMVSETDAATRAGVASGLAPVDTAKQTAAKALDDPKGAEADKQDAISGEGAAQADSAGDATEEDPDADKAEDLQTTPLKPSQPVEPVSGTFTKLTLDNANSVVEPKYTNPNKADKIHEGSLKKTSEATTKRRQEENNKWQRAVRMQMLNIEQRKIKSEQDNKRFEDLLQQRSEHFEKKSRERQQKSDDGLFHSLKEANAKEMHQKSEFAREQTLERARQQAQEDNAKAEQEIERKRVEEDTQKATTQHKMQALVEHRHFLKRAHEQHLKENKAKQQSELEQKRSDEQEQKENMKEQEKQEKRTAKMKERDEKQEHKKQEEAEKEKRRSETGSWCNCETIDMNFHENERWFECPDGKLMAGIERSDESQFVTAVTRFKCCQPCRGTNMPLKLHGCAAADWVRSFDAEGWSHCPSNKFMKGLYKSAGPYIYNLEYAQCCFISGSRGVSEGTCHAKGSWVLSLDRAGMSELDPDYFMTGLYRSGGHMLFNIELPHQCKFYSYATD